MRINATRDAEIVKKIHEGHTQEKVALMYGISRQRVSQVFRERTGGLILDVRRERRAEDLANIARLWKSGVHDFKELERQTGYVPSQLKAVLPTLGIRRRRSRRNLT